MLGQPPLYLQIQQFVRNGISSGDFRPGDRLPSETELARRFATTRATVARAFQELSFDGTVERRSGSGTFVTNPRASDRVDTHVISSHEDRLRAAGETIHYKVNEFREAALPAALCGLLAQEPGAKGWWLQRLRIAQGRTIAVEDRYLPDAIGSGLKPEWLEHATVQHLLSDRLGLRIARIENAVGATLADAAKAQWLGVPRGAALIVRSHVIFDSRNRPVLAGDTVYPGNFQLRYTLEGAQT